MCLLGLSDFSDKLLLVETFQAINTASISAFKLCVYIHFGNHWKLSPWYVLHLFSSFYSKVDYVNYFWRLIEIK